MRSRLSVLFLLLLLLQGFLQGRIYPLWQKNYAPKQATPVGLSPDQLLVAFGGFREFLAGILWVRADGFFHTGNYDAILPVLRLVTWLDPHQIDVYTTGAWHLAYNFTDESQRSDRRYIVPALKFLEEGIQNNKTVWDLYFEMGWTYYHKIQDGESAIPWLQKANEFPNMLTARRHMLAHAYEKAGRIDGAVKTWIELLERAEKEYAKDPKNEGLRQEVDVCRRNLEDTLIRLVRRLGPEPQTQPPIDLDFEATVKVVRPRVLLVEGHLGIPTIGARIDVILRNKGFQMVYDPNKLETFTFEVDKNLTYMQDSLAVRQEKFRREIDMSKDPKMYPFKASEYEIEMSYNPRYTSPHIQDRIGWNGEGITDDKYLEVIREPKVPPLRRVRKVITLTREQILALGQRTAQGNEGTQRRGQ